VSTQSTLPFKAGTLDELIERKAQEAHREIKRRVDWARRSNGQRHRYALQRLREFLK